LLQRREKNRPRFARASPDLDRDENARGRPVGLAFDRIRRTPGAFAKGSARGGRDRVDRAALCCTAGVLDQLGEKALIAELSAMNAGM
jgi:hypothetical protein